MPAAKKKKPPKRKVTWSAGPLPGTPQPPHPAEEKVQELTTALASVNATLIRRNDELDAAKAVASREVFKDVVVLTALLDAKAFLNARGGIEAALIVHGIAQVEQRLGPEAVTMATAIQKLKALAAEKRAGNEVFQEEVDSLLTYATRLL